jgi:flavin-dependent dehydrogenase
VIDVAIVGAGPAGAAAALACAQAGLSVVMLERQEGGRATDGTEAEESVAPDSIALLQSIGIDCAASSMPYSGVAIGSHVTLFLDGARVAGRHVRRSWLDRALRTAAARAGAECRQGVTVLGVARADDGFTLVSSAGPLAARWLIDASGRRSWLARRFGLSRRRLSPPLLAWRDVLVSPPDTTPIARFVPQADGWTFLAPVAQRRLVRTRLRSASQTLAGASAHAATWQVVRHMAGEGWFIAGDAAAALDPGAGTGIAFALRSGFAAARAVIVCAADASARALIAARYDGVMLDEFTATARGLAARYRELGIGVLDGGAAQKH